LALVTFTVEKSSLSGITLLCFGSVALTGYVEEAQPFFMHLEAS
jgi:hypothetical protein